jgi:hypothetical protein
MARTLGNGRYEVWMDSSMQPSITSAGYVTEPITQTEVKRTVLVQTTRYGAGMRGIITKQGLTMNGNTRVDSFDSENPAYSTNGRYDPSKAHDMGYAGSVYSDVYAEGDGVWGYIGTGASGRATGNAGDAAWMASHTGIQPGHYANDLNLSFPDIQAPFSGGASSPLNNERITTTNYYYLSNQVTSATYPSPEPPGGVTTNYTTVTTTNKPFTWSGTLTTNTSAASSTTAPADGTYVGNVTTRTVVTGKGAKAKTTTYYDYMQITGYTYQTIAYTYNVVTTNTTTQTDNYQYVTDTGNYQMSSLRLNGNDQFLVRGDTVLYITGDVAFTGNSKLVILPGASLKLYIAGSASLAGNGVFNLNQDATKFSLYGLPSCTSISLSGNAAFTGTIYAPSADLTLNGGGSTVYDCVGAIVTKSAYFHGHFQFHYDEKLGRMGGQTQFRIAYWSEI